jgi:hypothetical protein
MELAVSKTVQEREGTSFVCFDSRPSLADGHRSNLEDLVAGLLASLPRSSLLNIQKKIVPLLQLDVVGVSPFSKHQHLTESCHSFSRPRLPSTSFLISHQRPSYVAPWSVDPGAPLPMTTPSGNECASRRAGIGRIPLRVHISSLPPPTPRNMTQMTKEWVTKR